MIEKVIPDIYKHIILKYIDIECVLDDMRKVLDDPFYIVEVYCQTPEMCIESILHRKQSYIEILAFMREKTPNVCLTAVKKYPCSLRLVPDELKTEDMCVIAVRRDPMILKFVPDELKTEDMCVTSVDKNYKSIKYVKVEYLEKCLKIAKYNSKDVMKNVDIELPLDLCINIVKDFGQHLKHIKNQTPELCLHAMKNDSTALEHVRKDLQTEEMCIMAVQRNPSNIQYVREDLQTPSLCEIVVNKDPSTIKHVRCQTKELAEYAVGKDYMLYDHIHDEHKTANLQQIRDVAEKYSANKFVGYDYYGVNMV